MNGLIWKLVNIEYTITNNCYERPNTRFGNIVVIGAHVYNSWLVNIIL